MDINIGTLYKYYVALFLHNNLNDDTMLEDNNISIDDIYAYINLFWNSNFGSYLDINDESNKTRLYNFLDNIFKYRLLRDNIEKAFDNMFSNDKDKFILYNYEYLGDVIDSTFNKVSEFKNVEKLEYPYLSCKNLDKYFKEFLMFIDKDGDFLKVYEDMKANNRIVYLDDFSPIEQEKFLDMLHIKDEKYRNFLWANDKNGAYLVLDRNEDMLDFRTLAHEFTHYLVHYYNKDNTTSDVVREFPSIFYELLANNFLLSKGFDSKYVLNASEGRFKDFYESASMFGITNYYFTMFKETGDVTLDEDITRRKNQISNFIDNIGTARFKKYLEKDKDLNDPEKLADMFSMIANTLMFACPNSVKEGYHYVVGSHLASHYLFEVLNDKEHADLVFNKMKNYVMNLPNIDLNNLFKEVDPNFNSKKKKMSK